MEWTDIWEDKLTYDCTRTHSHKQKARESSSTFQKGENEEECQPAITATWKLYAYWDTWTIRHDRLQQ